MLQHTYRGCAGTELRYDTSLALHSRLLNHAQSRSVRIFTVRVSQCWTSCRTRQRRPRNSKEHRVNLIQEQIGLSTTCQKKRSAVTGRACFWVCNSTTRPWTRWRNISRRRRSPSTRKWACRVVCSVRGRVIHQSSSNMNTAEAKKKRIRECRGSTTDARQRTSRLGPPPYDPFEVKAPEKKRRSGVRRPPER